MPGDTPDWVGKHVGQPGIDPLFSGPGSIPPTTVVAGQAYKGILVQVLQTGVLGFIEPISVQNASKGNLTTTMSRTCIAAPGQFYVSVPVYCSAGDTLNITFGHQSGTITFNVWGTTEYIPTAAIFGIGSFFFAPGIRIRADGWPYPIGVQFEAMNANNQTSPLVAAPGAGEYLLLKWWEIARFTAGAAGVFGQITATINTVTGPIATVAGDAGTGPYTEAPEGGLLCDAATGLSVVSSGAVGFTASVSFDIVA